MPSIVAALQRKDDTMKKKIITIMLVGAMSMTVACGNPKTSQPNEPDQTNNEDVKSESSYQGILDEYTEKLKDGAQQLADEYTKEAEDMNGDINALTELSANKIEKLAEISTEGIEKMAVLNNDDNDDSYNAWATKLTDIYTKQSQIIMNAYTESVSGINAPESSGSDNTTETNQADKQKSDNKKAKDEQAKNKEVESGSYEIADSTFFFSDSVRDDVTEKWRLSKVNTGVSAEDYAKEYYETLFSSDDEIHAIVNFALNTTACLSVFSDKVNVCIYEYVDGEEHSAKDLFGGNKLGEYDVNIKTGKIEKIQ